MDIQADLIEAPIPTSRRRSWYQKLNFNGRVPIGHLLTWKTSLQKNNTKRLRIVPLGQGSPIPAGITPSWSTFHLYVGAHLCASELCSPWFFQFFEVEVTLSPSLLSGLVPIQYICPSRGRHRSSTVHQASDVSVILRCSKRRLTTHASF